MLSKTKLKMLLGAAALGAAGHALAATSAGTGGTIWLTVDDTTTGSSYMFDTGMSVSSFTGSGGYSTTLSSANWTSFVASVAGGNLATTTDVLHYGIIGASSSATTGAVPVTIDFTGQTPTQTARTNGQAGTMYTNANTFITNRANPNGSDSFLPAGSLTTSSFFQGGYETNFNNAAGNTDWSGIGGAMAFFQSVNSSHSGLGVGSASTFAGTWDLTAAGLLSYTVASSVPLPAPLLLLLSGLGVTGLLGRRGKSGSGETRTDGAA